MTDSCLVNGKYTLKWIICINLININLININLKSIIASFYSIYRMINPSRYHVADGEYIDKLCDDTDAISKHHQLNKNYTIHQQTLHDTPTKITRYTILNTRKNTIHSIQEYKNRRYTF